MDSLSAWLQEFGLERYAPVFAENGVDLNSLRLLTDGDLKELGVLLGHRRTLLEAISQLKGSDAQPLTARPIQASVSAQIPLSGEAERRQLTVMFCDLVGSTALSQELDPEELRDLMRAYQRACSEVIERYEGHIAQYLGDGLMVYFGWPGAHEDDPVRAIRAGLEVTRAVAALKGSAPMSARVGIHTGLVVVGQTGEGDASIPKAAVGDTPNIAARLQALAPAGTVVVSERTRALAEGLFEYADLGAQLLKGVVEQMHLFRVVGVSATQSRFEAAHGGLALTPLVGREEEVALLLRRWQQACDGEGQVVLVSGEPGIGKSRLIQVLREQISGEPYSALCYQCSPYHRNSTLYPIIEQFEFAAGFAREDTAEQRLEKMEALLVGSEVQIAEALPLFAALLSLPTERYPPLKLSPQKQKEKTLEALASQIEALAYRQPVLLAFEDVHWVDPTSQEWIDVLVPRLHSLPVLLLITYRPEYTPHWSEQSHVSTLGLSRLGRRMGAELVAKLTGGRGLPAEVLEQIVTHTDGVPLFVEELTKSVLESELLREADDEYTLRAPLSALAIPTSLRDSLLARLDRLAPVKEIAQIGACIGREFSYDLLARISTLSDDQLEEALRKLVEAGLVYRRGSPPDATYTFKHALVQDAAYDSLLKSRRSQLHAEIAEVLEKDFCDRAANEPELLAHHYTQAGNLAAAIPLWRKAGDLAIARVALQEAVAHFQKGLVLIDQQPPSAERDWLELTIRDPLNAAWIGLRGWAASEVTVNAAAILERAKSQGKPQSLLIGLYGMFANTLTQGRIAESLEWAQRLVAEGDQAEDTDLQSFGHRAQMICHLYLGQLLEAREEGNRVLALYDPQRAARWMQLTGQDWITSVGIYAAQWTWMLGYPDEAVNVSEKKDAHARKLGHPFNLGFALSYGASAFDYRCEAERLLDRVGEAERIAHEQGVPFIYQVSVPETKGLGLLRSGQLSESISSLLRGMENRSRLGGRITIPYMKSAIAEARALQGDLDAGLHLVDECLEQIERPGWHERVHLAEILRLKGWMLMRQGRVEEAETQLQASINCARQQRAKSWELRSSTTLAGMWAERGKRDAARQLLAPIYGWFTEGFDTKDLKDAKALLEDLGKGGLGRIAPARV